jgi:nucleoside-diphosphate-sugar epimerase
MLRLDVADESADTLASALAPLRPALVVNAAGAVWDVTDDQLVTGNVVVADRVVVAVATLPRPARLVHLGSVYEYGGHPDRPRLTEDLPPRPVSRYSQTKLIGTQLVMRAAAAGRVDAVVLRLTLASGPYAPRHGLLGGLARQLAERPDVLRLPPIHGTRDIVDARDVAGAVLCAAAAPQPPPVVNIGSGTGTRLTDAVELLIEISGCEAPIVRTPEPAVRRDAGIGDQPLDIGLARRRLGWAPVRTLPDTLRALWDSVARSPEVQHARN